MAHRARDPEGREMIGDSGIGPPGAGGPLPARGGGRALALLPSAILGLALLALASPALAATRMAVIVGANAAVDGRRALRYAHDDAQSLARTLVEVAGFSPSDVETFLDARPEEILRALDRRLAALGATSGETLLLFYFSGHADGAALYSGGRPLPLAELKRRLSDPRAAVRVGIVDACNGGAWTGAKGLRPAPDFEVEAPLVLGSEGSVLLAASSGLDDAHESEALGGSFFTHHLVAALRGAADRNGRGEVTLHEAFDYAQLLTVRDSALATGQPQRPSFEVNLRGRRDLTLARIEGSPNQVALLQEEGPLQLIRLDTGLQVLELPPGRRRVVAALPAGRYLVRRRTEAGTFARELDLKAGARLELREDQLHAVGREPLASKGAAEPPPSTLSPGQWALQLAMGRTLSSARYTGNADAELGGFVGLRVGLTDRVELAPLPVAVSWRLGRPGAFEAILHTRLGPAYTSDGLYWLPMLGSQARLYLGNRSSLMLGLEAGTVAVDPRAASSAFRRWQWAVRGGWILRLSERVSLAAGAGLIDRLDPATPLFARSIDSSDRPQVELGSSLNLGASPLPLASVELLDDVFVDGYASVRLGLDGSVHEAFQGGLTWKF
ncbi:caspase family protein [Vulgatibacter incomptus]|uniref:Peptidase C14 caspase catalytic subunit p20 n=1 Tax=Vulgatibacter incomptus TaxID=1391653 RepID=A0A0K1PCY0_9BACT|nr:caspase family protein [Vulgatibacter incomptus]AKU91398.1 peptidase C14 caspase catalytic subunit p20 [Vulgatibacter incomptus]